MKMGQQSLAAFFFCCSLGTDVGVWEKHLSEACDRSSYALVPVQPGLQPLKNFALSSQNTPVGSG